MTVILQRVLSAVLLTALLSLGLGTALGNPGAYGPDTNRSQTYNHWPPSGASYQYYDER